MSAMLEIKDLHVAYGKVEAVRGVSLSLQPGQIVTVIGPNGAGKTTLLAATIGLLPSRGRLMFDGEDLVRLDVEERVEHGFCLVPETRELFGDMTVSDNLVLGAYPRRRDGAFVNRSAAAKSMAAFRASPSAGGNAQTLSGGERQMLALGRAMMAAPRLLMLDEPSLGLAPLIVREILRIVAALRELGVSILLVEQNARAALEIADYGYVLETGEVTHQGEAGLLGKRARGRQAISAEGIDLMASRVPVTTTSSVAAPVTVPYVRYSIRGAHWFLGRALAALIDGAGIAEGRASTALRRELHAGARHRGRADPASRADAALARSHPDGRRVRHRLDPRARRARCRAATPRSSPASPATPTTSTVFAATRRASASSRRTRSIPTAPADRTRASRSSPPITCAPMARRARISASSASPSAPMR